jgi:hypothetical protein
MENNKSRQKTECLVPGSASPPREFKRCALRCARGLRAVTDGVAVVTPQARDDFWAGPIILVLVGCCKHSVSLCVECVYKQSFLDFAGMVGAFSKKKMKLWTSARVAQSVRVSLL